MTRYPLHDALMLITGAALSACGWIYPSEELRDVPDGLALPRPATCARLRMPRDLGSDQSPRLFFGLGSATRVEWLVISWADGHETVVKDPPVNRPLRIHRFGTPLEHVKPASDPL